jgi:hypothetical protein
MNEEKIIDFLEGYDDTLYTLPDIGSRTTSNRVTESQNKEVLQEYITCMMKCGDTTPSRSDMICTNCGSSLRLKFAE